MTFFEIDPVVIEVASDPRFFTYLADAPIRPTVIEGDARLSFEDEPDGRYDLLIMDAFSSDSVPIHLLTVEAIADEIRTTKPDGTLVFHISNRYYNLAPAIAAAVSAQGLTILEKTHNRARSRSPARRRRAGSPPQPTRHPRTSSARKAGPRSSRRTARSPTTTPTCCTGSGQ